MSFMEGKIIPAQDAYAERGQRWRRLLRATMSNARLGHQEVLVRNVSARGLGATTRGIVPLVGEAVTVELPEIGKIAGVVRWNSATGFGLELATAIDPDQLQVAIRNQNAQSAPATDWSVRSRHRIAPPASRGSLRRV